jgi:putative acetyltransferase
MDAAATNPAVLIERVLAPDDDVRQLITELDAELGALYPPEQRHGLRLDAIFQPHVRFFVARTNGLAVGCGGVALFEEFAEIKRMYVRPDSRGQGIADEIVARLLEEAAANGKFAARLETGTLQLAAVRFYERCGFQRCEAFEPYASMPSNKIVNSLF